MYTARFLTLCSVVNLYASLVFFPLTLNHFKLIREGTVRLAEVGVYASVIGL